MKITVEFNKTRILILSVVLVFLLVSGITVAQRTRRTAEAPPTEQPNIAAQFGTSFVCMISQCGWPALVFLILPAVAVFVWKKFFSWG
ncbi:TPA: hypothetical protein H1005_00215 [archaeon]|nr:hypothetical protein [Candidatus Naiadarchaeales archaeon SRR2090153.bin1042]